MNDMLFYQDKMDSNFRFGDVLKGLVLSTPNLIDLPLASNNTVFNLNISMPDYCVIVSPCCAIADQVLSLSPLIPVLNTFFKNPYFEEDLTRINREILPDKTLPHFVWEKLPDEEKLDRLSKGMAYTFLDFFIYKEHPIFPKYEVHRKGAENMFTSYYMIDFRNTFRINCSKIKKPDVVPLEAKCLQLTIDARKELREKIAFYYGNPPMEDIAI